MSTMLGSADIVARHRDGRTALLVEIKNRENLTPDVAAYFREGLESHGMLRAWSPEFLMITSQDHGYVWDERQHHRGKALPDAQFSMKKVVERYAPNEDKDYRLGNPRLEVIVATWLNSVSSGDADQIALAGPAFADVGLADAIEDADVDLELDR